MLLAINYHYIRPEEAFNGRGIHGVTPGQFRDQLMILSAFGSFVSSADIQEWIISDNYPSNDKLYFHVTFDDGLTEQFDYARPVLLELGIPATFFINTQNFSNSVISDVHKIHILLSKVNSGVILDKMNDFTPVVIQLSTSQKEAAHKHYNYDDFETAYIKYILNFVNGKNLQSDVINRLFNYFFEDQTPLKNNLYMNEGQLKILMKENSIGSHGFSHTPMSHLGENILKEQMNSSLAWFSNYNYIPNSISYPYGSLESLPNLNSLNSFTNFSYGFTMERAANEFPLQNKMFLSRFDCNDLPGGKNPIFHAEDILQKKINKSAWPV